MMTMMMVMVIMSGGLLMLLYCFVLLGLGRSSCKREPGLGRSVSLALGPVRTQHIGAFTTRLDNLEGKSHTTTLWVTLVHFYRASLTTGTTRLSVTPDLDTSVAVMAKGKLDFLGVPIRSQISGTRRSPRATETFTSSTPFFSQQRSNNKDEW